MLLMSMSIQPSPLNTPNPKQNRLLAALPESESKRLVSYMELVALPIGESLYESGSRSNHVYFPTTAIVSLLHVLGNGASAEIAMVGNMGIVGVALFLGGDTILNRAVVRNAGQAYRLEVKLLQKEFNRVGALHYSLLRYTLALMSQMAQIAVCNRFHTVDQQLCRWLLLNLDRLPANELSMTQEQISSLLGVSRESVTAVAGKLQRAGLIHYSRGRIIVLNRAGLEERVCECYNVVRGEFCRLLPDAAAE